MMYEASSPNKICGKDDLHGRPSALIDMFSYGNNLIVPVQLVRSMRIESTRQEEALNASVGCMKYQKYVHGEKKVNPSVGWCSAEGRKPAQSRRGLACMHEGAQRFCTR